jgi:hypothetical protein
LWKVDGSAIPPMRQKDVAWMGHLRVGVERTKGKSKNNRRSFDSFHALRETSLRMTRCFVGDAKLFGLGALEVDLVEEVAGGGVVGSELEGEVGVAGRGVVLAGGEIDAGEDEVGFRGGLELDGS